MRLIFDSPTRPIDPASTVKSYAAIATRRPSIAPMPGDGTVGGEEPALVGAVHAVGEHAVLDPRTGIEQQVESFANRQLAEVVLTLDALGATHCRGRVAALREIVDERSPVVHVAATAPCSVPPPNHDPCRNPRMDRESRDVSAPQLSRVGVGRPSSSASTTAIKAVSSSIGAGLL